MANQPADAPPGGGSAGADSGPAQSPPKKDLAPTSDSSSEPVNPLADTPSATSGRITTSGGLASSGPVNATAPTIPVGPGGGGVVQGMATGMTSGGVRRGTTQELAAGMIIADRYQVVERLSAGGMGVVYKARHIALDDMVALKLLLKPQREEDQRRFLLEARVATKIKHPNTVYISDFGVLPDGRSYLAMEFLQGQTLAHALKKLQGRHSQSSQPTPTVTPTKAGGGPLPNSSTSAGHGSGGTGSNAQNPDVIGMDPVRACRIAVQIARGLQSVHDKGIVHRDRTLADLSVEIRAA